MGASVNKMGNSGRRKSHVPPALMSEINVTPFVDVMLVLLIIFMVSAPLLTVGVPIDLPESKAKALNQSQEEPLTISINSDGAIYLQETEISADELVAKLQAIIGSDTQQRVFVRGDRAVDYGSIMQIMGRLSQAGYTRVALITATES